MLTFTVLSSAQVELNAFGLFNLNLSYSSYGEIDPYVRDEVSTWHPEWQAFFDAVLKQNSGVGLGGRIAFYITPTISIEGSLEHIMADTAFTEGIVDDLTAKWGDWIDTANESGGSITRYYGNIVFNIPYSERLNPYITAGVGITRFKLGEGVGPEVETKLEPWGVKLHLYYKDASALTFNCGLGVKAFFTPHLGIRFDARAFFCRPKFIQKFNSEILYLTDIIEFDHVDSFIQSGIHMDSNLNIGFFTNF